VERGLLREIARVTQRVETRAKATTSRETVAGAGVRDEGGSGGGGASTIEPACEDQPAFSRRFSRHCRGIHNLLAALVDAHIFHGNDLNLDPERITWPRTMDMNDRALRDIVVNAGSKKEGMAQRADL